MSNPRTNNAENSHLKNYLPVGRIKMYFGFKKKEDLEKEFSIKLNDSINILFAFYGDEGSLGVTSFIIFENNGLLYEVEASHCSCHGLEDQWEPKETTWEALDHYLQKGTKFEDFDPTCLAYLKDLVNKNLE